MSDSQPTTWHAVDEYLTPDQLAEIADLISTAEAMLPDLQSWTEQLFRFRMAANATVREHLGDGPDWDVNYGIGTYADLFDLAHYLVWILREAWCDGAGVDAPDARTVLRYERGRVGTVRP
jgi:hypothetical protein